MSNNIALILMVLFTAGGIVYAVYAFAVKKAYRDRKMAAFHGLYSLILVLQGSAFLFYFPFNRFSFLANMV
ncbi:MAG: hypothetical protein LBQ57_05500, partial [Spirochaetales bacterium]|nr:hypothetical protein [Spirochaetales bacterium]